MKYKEILFPQGILKNRQFKPDLDTEDTVKGSNSFYNTIDNCIIYGGKEDALDVVSGKCLEVLDTIFMRPGKRFITLKGQLNDVYISECRFIGRPSWWFDVTIGDHNIYGMNEPVTDVTFDRCVAYTKGGGRARRLWILCLHAERPKVIATRAVVVMVPRPIVKALWWINDILHRKEPEVNQDLVEVPTGG